MMILQSPPKLEIFVATEVISKYEIAKKYNVTPACVVTAGERLSCGDMALIFRERVYVVKPLDTLFDIAVKFGVTPQEILTKNNCSQIFTGQKLII